MAAEAAGLLISWPNAVIRGLASYSHVLPWLTGDLLSLKLWQGNQRSIVMACRAVVRNEAGARRLGVESDAGELCSDSGALLAGKLFPGAPSVFAGISRAMVGVYSSNNEDFTGLVMVAAGSTHHSGSVSPAV